MKRSRSAAWSVIVIAALAGTACLAQGSPRGTAKLDLGGKTVSVEYGRPSLKGRTMQQLLGRLKVGGFWRLGADDSTTFSTDADLAFGDVTVPKGKYSIWARKEAGNKWTLVFNKKAGVFGTDHDPSADFASVPLGEGKASDNAEELTLSLDKHDDGGTFAIHWGDTQLSAEFKAK